MPQLAFKMPSTKFGEFDAEFRSRVSYINRKLRVAMGEATALRLAIVGPGERGARDGQYGLMNLDPSLIQIN